MIEKDNIKELFNQKLSGHEAPVNPELWNAISSQIGSAGAATSAVTIKSIILKSVIGFSVVSIAVASYIYITNPEESLESTKPTPSLIKKDNKLNQEEPLLLEDPKILIKAEDDDVNNKTVTKPSQVLITPKDDILLNEDQSSSTPFVENEDSVKLNNPNEIIIIRDDLWKPIIENVKSDVEELVVTAGTPDDIIVEESEEATLPFKKPAVVQAEDENITKSRIIMPNVFTPNGDGSNDLLFIESELLTGFSVVVLDLNNQVIFKSSDPNFKWDGRMLNGDMAPSGTYVYYVTAIDQQGNAVQKHSSLRINR
jgi:gliding motility-associated-like protein